MPEMSKKQMIARIRGLLSKYYKDPEGIDWWFDAPNRTLGHCAPRKLMDSNVLRKSIMEILEKNPEWIVIFQSAYVARCWEILSKLYTDPREIQEWFNARHPDLGGVSPQHMIDYGRAEVVCDMLEVLYAGDPT